MRAWLMGGWAVGGGEGGAAPMGEGMHAWLMGGWAVGDGRVGRLQSPAGTATTKLRHAPPHTPTQPARYPPPLQTLQQQCASSPPPTHTHNQPASQPPPLQTLLQQCASSPPPTHTTSQIPTSPADTAAAMRVKSPGFAVGSGPAGWPKEVSKLVGSEVARFRRQFTTALGVGVGGQAWGVYLLFSIAMSDEYSDD